jgi:nucleotide-binding universal stress UspA family protein
MTSFDLPGTEPFIVVGVDGSNAAIGAATWAAAEAQRRGVKLCVLHAYSYPTLGFGRVVASPELDRTVRERAETILETAVQAVTSSYPGVTIRAQLELDSPVALLRNASRTAVLTVVGSHGEHQLTEALIGSVAAKVSEHAFGPVVVIRADHGPARPDDGPVVVGLDGSENSEDALALAFEEAALRRVPLLAVRAWDSGALQGFLGVSPLVVDEALVDEQEARLLADQLAVWQPKYPEVVARPEVAQGSAVKVLLRRCTEADRSGRLPSLVVVGSRGRGGFTGLLLGSTSRALIAHAPCGVAVVRPA